MNTNYILELVRDNSIDGTFTYQMFENLFGSLENEVQYEIVELLNNNGIEIIDDDNYEAIASNNGELNDTYNSYIAADAKKAINEAMTNEELVLLAQHGNEEARSQLCVRNSGLVRKAANQYLRYLGNDLEWEDLLQEGSIGLLRAIDMFQFTFGTKFSTYALIWIRQKMRRAIVEQGFTVTLPVHMSERITKVCRLDRRYTDEGISSRSERYAKIAKAMNLKVDDVVFAIETGSHFLSLASLDAPVGEDGDATMVDFVSSENTENPEDMAIASDTKDVIERALNELSPREKQVIILRFGLDDNGPHTLEEVGEVFNVTRERIRQIEAKALKKLAFKPALRSLAAA